MGDQLDRLERDRALFDDAPRQRMSQVIAHANPVIVAGVVIKALEMQVLAEEFARAQGIEPDDEALARFQKRHHKELSEQLDRAMTLFIGAVVSQEG